MFSDSRRNTRTSLEQSQLYQVLLYLQLEDSSRRRSFHSRLWSILRTRTDPAAYVNCQCPTTLAVAGWIRAASTTPTVATSTSGRAGAPLDLERGETSPADRGEYVGPAARCVVRRPVATGDSHGVQAMPLRPSVARHPHPDGFGLGRAAHAQRQKVVRGARDARHVGGHL